MKEVIILLGPPASGKGTQARLLGEKLGYLHLSTGSLLRQEIETGSELGKQIAALIDYGNLVPDEMMFRVLMGKLNDKNARGFILDGFPRTLNQAEMFSKYLETNPELKLSRVFVIKVDKKQIMDRIGNRFACKKCGEIYNTSTKMPKVKGVCDVCGSTDFEDRNDDKSVSAVEQRIDIFDANIGEIVSFYEKKSLIFPLDGLKSIETINREIIKALGY